MSTKCSKCNKILVNAEDRIHHTPYKCLLNQLPQKVHTGLLICPILSCDCVFSKWTLVIKHIKRVHRPYSCRFHS